MLLVLHGFTPPAKPKDSSIGMAPDIHSTLRLLRDASSSASEEWEHFLRHVVKTKGKTGWILCFVKLCRWNESGNAPSDLATADSPLAGLAVPVKHLFDMSGEPRPAASTYATSGAGRRAGGGAITGSSHMLKFAFSVCSTCPHVPPLLAYDGRLGPIPGDARVPNGFFPEVAIERGAPFSAAGFIDLVHARWSWGSGTDRAIPSATPCALSQCRSSAIVCQCAASRRLATGKGCAARRQICARQPPSSAQPGRGDYAWRLRAFSALPGAGRIAYRTDGVARRNAR